MKTETIEHDIIGQSFALLWPKETRPVRLFFAPGVMVKHCIIATPGGPDRATMLNQDGNPIQEVASMTYENPHSILLEWDD